MKIKHIVLTALGLGAATYLSLYAIVAHRAYQLLDQSASPADTAIVLGNRAYLNGAPNPCLTGRVDKALDLAQAGLVQDIVFSGGMDVEDKRIEAEVMQTHAREQGYQGDLLLEKQSTSTRENLKFSLPLLQADGSKNIIIVSEPYHAWRVERLVRANPDYKSYKVQYAAAPTYCWTQWGMGFKGALREPVAIVNNFVKGYF